MPHSGCWCVGYDIAELPHAERQIQVFTIAEHPLVEQACLMQCRTAQQEHTASGPVYRAILVKLPTVDFLPSDMLGKSEPRAIVAPRPPDPVRRLEIVDLGRNH